MKSVNANQINRKFGKPRDLLCAFPKRNGLRKRLSIYNYQ
jgi:hypothetical protein